MVCVAHAYYESPVKLAHAVLGLPFYRIIRYCRIYLRTEKARTRLRNDNFMTWLRYVISISSNRKRMLTPKMPLRINANNEGRIKLMKVHYWPEESAVKTRVDIEKLRLDIVDTSHYDSYF